MATKKKDILDKLAEEVDKIKEEGGAVQSAKTKKAPAVKVAEEADLSPMAILLEENPVKIPQLGDVLEGIVIDITSNSLLLDLGALGTGIVLGKEIKDGLAEIG